MDTYSLLREFADSWFLVAMLVFFLAVVIWAYLPSQKAARDDAAGIPLRDEPVGCAKNCTDCACSSAPDAEVRQ